VLALLLAGCPQGSFNPVTDDYQSGSGEPTLSSSISGEPTSSSSSTSTASPTTSEPPSCGDGLIDGSEVCDNGPGNTANVWEQTPTCKDDCSGLTQYCGDGLANGPELCDDGAANSDLYTGTAHCNASCTAQVPYCGDGVCQAEESLAQCPGDCAPACGDGEIEAGEQCDGGGDTQACDGDCTFAACGDSYVNRAANEACDDGNQVETDACLNNCTEASCGDGVVQTGVEACDDGNDVDTDACSNACVPPRRVFVTTGKYNGGDIQGVLGADTICKNAAAAVPGLGAPGNTWLAWLSDGMSSPSTRIDVANKSFTGWYLLPTGVPVAKGWSGLTDGMLDNPIQVTEAGMVAGNPLVAWTNTKTDGTSAGPNDCGDWNSANPDIDSGYGDITQTSAAWTQAATLTCAAALRLYCLEITP
jgi:cysteine-rich repeat protein